METSNGKTELMKKTDQVEIGLIATYIVQKQNMITLKEIIEIAEQKLGCTMEEHDLERALEGLKKRNILGSRRQKVHGQSRPVWHMKSLNWKSPPEYAHVTDLLPALLQTPELQAVKDFFDAKEDKGDQKKKRGNDIDDYRFFRVTAVTLDPLLGSQIKSEYSDAIAKAHPSAADQLEVDGMFQRDELTGAYIIPPDVMQGWLVTNGFRYAGLPEARAGYVAFQPIHIRPSEPAYKALKDGKVYQYVLPVNSSKTGPAAPKAYEAIPSGQLITIEFTAPTKGCLLPEQFEKLFHIAGLSPRRGISPARGRRFGRFLVTKFEDLGAVKEAVSIDHLFDSVPKELLQQNSKYLDEARKRLSGVSLSISKGGFVGEEEHYPSGGVVAEA